MNGSVPIRPSSPERETEREIEIRRTEERSAVERRAETPEAIREQEPQSEQPETREAPLAAPPPAPAGPSTARPIATKSPELLAVEQILEENLQDIYQRLTPTEQAAFRVSGEATASKLAQLLRAASVKVKEVLTLIRDWLKSLPGVNAFFLEQEAKIKTDKLLALRDRNRPGA